MSIMLRSLPSFGHKGSSLFPKTKRIKLCIQIVNKLQEMIPLSKRKTALFLFWRLLLIMIPFEIIWYTFHLNKWKLVHTSWDDCCLQGQLCDPCLWFWLNWKMICICKSWESANHHDITSRWHYDVISLWSHEFADSIILWITL